ncbi:MAG TPA: hypothetical protein VFE58_13660 [Tepidisphaeraceae bacterium]|jgi:hypothetical protein|nr:hypothetical protein [Tepidisphaeraceae bacterium]
MKRSLLTYLVLFLLEGCATVSSREYYLERPNPDNQGDDAILVDPIDGPARILETTYYSNGDVRTKELVHIMSQE